MARNNPSSSKTFGESNVLAFRLRRHRLLGQHKAGLSQVVSDACGLQAQVLSSTYLQMSLMSDRMSKVLGYEIDVEISN
ncbi:MAG TPA: hypothetical protein VIS48_16320 [Candidatus Kryptonia bacterium]